MSLSAIFSKGSSGTTASVVSALLAWTLLVAGLTASAIAPFSNASPEKTSPSLLSSSLLWALGCLAICIAGRAHRRHLRQLNQMAAQQLKERTEMEHRLEQLTTTHNQEIDHLQAEIAECREEATALEHTSSEMTRVFNCTGEAIRVIDRDYRVLHANNRFCRLFGEQRDTVIDNKCFANRHSRLCGTDDCPLLRILDGETRVEYLGPERIADGTTVPLLLTGTPFYDQQGAVCGIVEIFRETIPADRPVTAPIRTEESGQGKQGATRSDKKRILFVDDEQVLVTMTQQLMEELGYLFEGETSPVVALERFRQNPHHYDLVITDQTMPQLNGLEMAQAMLDVRPELPVILYSGYNEKMTIERAQEMGIKAFLLKPVTPTHLAHSVWMALADDAPAEIAQSFPKRGTAVPEEEQTDEYQN